MLQRGIRRLGRRLGGGDPIAELFARLGGTGTWVDPLAGQTVFSDTAGTTQAVQDGLVARIDAAGGVQASFQNATASQQPLLRADGLEFDGVDDRLVYPDDPALRFGLTDFTIAFACRPDTVTGNHDIWSKRGSGGAGASPGWGLWQSGANLILKFDDGTSFGVIVAPGVFAVGAWLSGLVTIDRAAGTATARIGGTDFSPVAIPAGDISGTLPLVIGAGPGGVTPLLGRTGRLLVIDRLLSAQDKATVEAWLQAGFA